jgi:hypothetical protein
MYIESLDEAQTKLYAEEEKSKGIVLQLGKQLYNGSI